MMFYFCLGEMPSTLVNEKFKVNLAFILTAIITLALQTTVPVRMWIHELKEQKRTNPEQQNPIRTYFNQKLNKEGLFRFQNDLFTYSRANVIKPFLSAIYKVLY